MRPDSVTHSTTTEPAGASLTVVTAVTVVAGSYTGRAAASLMSRATGTVPCCAASIAASLASTQTSEPSVVTR